MKNILIVEDDENKFQQLSQFITELLPNSIVRIAKSFHSGLKNIIDGSQDLILLDMTMPTYDIEQDEDGGRPQHYAGREIMRQMDRRSIRVPVIIVTQFDVFGEGTEALTRDQLDQQLLIEHPNTYKGTVYYNVAMDEWKIELSKKVASLMESE